MSSPVVPSASAPDASSADRSLREALRLRRLVSAIRPQEIKRRFEYDRRLLPNGFLQRCEERVTTVQQAMPLSGISPGYPSWNLLYFALLTTIESDPIVVETGTHRGVSTIVLAQALKDAGLGGKVHSVDIDPALVRIAEGNVADAGLSAYVEVHVGDSVIFLREWVRTVPKIDFAFIDGDHTYTQVVAEFEAIRERVSSCRGKIFFDNTATGGVADALTFIRTTYGGNQIEFRNCSWGPPGNVIWQP